MTPSEFVWADAPLSSVQAPATAAVCYTLFVLLLARLKPSVETKPLQAVHNLILCGMSAAMALGTLREVVARSSSESSVRWLFCENPATQPTGALWFWSYLYYLSKYYELLDTVLQLLKGRPPPHFGLHVYHHAFVLLMAWGWLEYVQTLQYIGLLFNTSVHVLMYYYYYCRVVGKDVWWKRYVTQFQIVQFATSLGCYVVTLYLIYSGAECAGTRALALNFVFNLTLLHSFVGVLNTGSKAKAAKKV